VPMPGLAAVFLSGRGCGRRSELVEAGFTPHAISSMVRSGEIERVRIGWYVPRGADPMLRQAVRVGGRLACVSAAGHIGLWVPEGSALHVAVARNASRFRSPSAHPLPLSQSAASAGVDLHWLSTPGTRCEGVSSLRECLAEVVDCQPVELAVAVVDSALNLAAITTAGLHELLSSTTRGRAVLGLVDGRAESGIESIARVRLRRAGIRAHVQVVAAPGIRVDLLIDGWLVIELDGSRYHSGPAEFEADRARDAVLATWAYRTLHFSYRQVMDDWDFVYSTILAVRSQGAPAGRRPV